MFETGKFYICEKVPDNPNEKPGWDVRINDAWLKSKLTCIKMSKDGIVGLLALDATVPEAYLFHIKWVEPWREPEPKETEKCRCDLMRGCACGVFAKEMLAKGYCFDQTMRIWQQEKTK